MDIEGLIERLVEIWLWLWPQIESVGGILKIIESALLLVTIGGLFWIGRRIRKNAQTFTVEIERTTLNLESRLLEVSGTIQKKFSDSSTNLDRSVERLFEGVDTVTTRVNMLRAAVSEIEKQQDRTFASFDQIPASQAEVSEGLAYWEQVRDSWSEVRLGLQEIVLSIPSKQKRDRFASLDWRDYAGAIEKMRKGNLISEEARDKAARAMGVFYSVRNRKLNTTREQALLAIELSRKFLELTRADRNEGVGEDQGTISRGPRQSPADQGASIR